MYTLSLGVTELVDFKKLAEEAQKIADEQRWASSVCAACGVGDCYGTCPGYAEWEAAFLASDKDSKFVNEQKLKMDKDL